MSEVDIDSEQAVAALHPLMNDTKWDELRLAMYRIDPPPLWSTSVIGGYRSALDREWFYHFRNRGYKDIVLVDILADDPMHRERIREALRTIHLPGSETEKGFRIYGYASPDQSVDYL